MANKRRRAIHATPAERASIRRNSAAHWKAYHSLQKKVNQAWNHLKTTVRRKARPSQIIKSRNELLLLLGECNYLAKEYKKTATQGKRLGMTALKAHRR